MEGGEEEEAGWGSAVGQLWGSTCELCLCLESGAGLGVVWEAVEGLAPGKGLGYGRR